MKKLKPLNILDNMGFWPGKAAVVDAIKEVLALGAALEQMPVQDYGRYRSPRWRDENNNLVPWQSVDWYVYDALDEERMQVDSSRLLDDLADQPRRDASLTGDHYDLFLLEEDMYDPAESAEDGDVVYAVGRCKPFSAAAISTHRIEHIWSMSYSCVKTEVMRQVCFMFGIPSRHQGGVEIGEDGRTYCANTCILRRARVAPEDWERLSADRIKHGPLCQSCAKDLQAFCRDALRSAS